jgi:N-acetylmuramoyl-L-alanine amidase
VIRIGEHPSPNFGERAPGKPVDMIVLHYTGLPSAAAALNWLSDPRSEVSSHYFVFEDGGILRLVDEGHRAWHAGKSFWAGEIDINSRSIGIEIANPGHEYGYQAFPEPQIAAVVALCRDIFVRHPVPPERVLAHSDVAPFRKDDPGELFPWDLLHSAGVGNWVPPEPITKGPFLQLGERGRRVETLRKALRAYGYDLAEGDEFDAALVTIVRAFQRHFRPVLTDGVADASTVATLERLAVQLRRK